MAPALTGCLHPSNRDCIHWNEKGLVAFGCHNVIVVVDVFTLQRVHTLEVHKAAINKVCWSPAASLASTARDDELRLASSDIGGFIVVSHLVSGEKKSQFRHANSYPLDLRWFVWKDLARDFILALHSSRQVVLWNADTGDRIWMHTYQVPVFSFDLNPHNPSNVALSSTGNSLLLVEDMSLHPAPSSSGHFLRLPIDVSTSADSSAIVSLRFNPAFTNLLFVACRDQVFVVEAESRVILRGFAVEGSPLLSLLPASLRDVLYVVQSGGFSSLRLVAVEGDEERGEGRFAFPRLVSSDSLRASSQLKAVAASLCPVTQSNFVLLYNTGQLLFYKLENEDSLPLYRSTYLTDLLSFHNSLTTKSIGDLKLKQFGLFGGLSKTATCVRVRPLSRGEELEETAGAPLDGLPLAAVGTHGGLLHLVHLDSSQILREFQVQPSPIRCLEWGGPWTVISAGFNHSLSASSVVRNDIFSTDILSGESRRIRPETDESPVDLIRVSFYHCYLAISFRDQPLEIWDLNAFRPLRKMSRSCPLIVDMAWACKYHAVRKAEGSDLAVFRENLVVLDSENRLYHVVVKAMHVRDGKEVNTQWKSGGVSVKCMAWKDDSLAIGDSSGCLSVWDLAKKESRSTRPRDSPISRLAFSPLTGDKTLVALHSKELAFWDAELLSLLQVIRLEAPSIDFDMSGVSAVLLSSDNSLRVISPGQTASATIPQKDLPVLLNSTHVEAIRSSFPSLPSEATLVSSTVLESLRSLVSSSKFPTSRLSQQALLARFLGDTAVDDLLQIVESRRSDVQLAPHLQLFWQAASFRAREWARLRVLFTSGEMWAVSRAVILGGKGRELAVDALLSMPGEDLRLPSFRAALLVSDHSSEHAHSIIKLVATNLIASDFISEGVELLFLIGDGADACKYMQSQKLWTRSLVFAKMGLANPTDVVEKWMQHLAIEEKSRELLCRASEGQKDRVEALLVALGRSSLVHVVNEFL